MKRFFVQWETDYCDDFPEEKGGFFVTAKDYDEAYKIANTMLPSHACMDRLDEVEE